VLAAGTAAQASFAAVLIGLPVLAPAIRNAYDLSLVSVGFALDAFWIGSLLTLLPWGLLADRLGERLVLALGLGGCGAALVGAAHAGEFVVFFVLLALAGAAGASVNAASGRAVMYWFSPAERGFALGVRQTAIPLGGLIAAVALPQLGLRSGLLLLAALCVAGAVFGAAVIHEPEATEDVLQPRPLGATLRDGRLWLLCGGSSFYLVAQVALTGFVVLFLYDERGFSPGEAAAVLAGIQVLAVVLRIGGGRWSDMIGSRIRPLRLVGLASGVTLALVAVLLDAPTALLVAALVVAGGFAMGWNGLSFTAAAELAGRARSGAALGMQQTALAGAGAIVPPAFAAIVAASSWRVGFALAAVFPFVGVQLLRPLRGS
jgi:sugar phosphate permease